MRVRLFLRSKPVSRMPSAPVWRKGSEKLTHCHIVWRYRPRVKMRMMDMVSGGRWVFGEERLIDEGGGGPKAVTYLQNAGVLI